MIDPLSGNAAAYTQALTGAAPATDGQTSVLASVAVLLGMGTEDVVSALRGGASMSGLATQKGVSRDDLLAAIVQGLQSSSNPAAWGASGDTGTLAARIADRVGLGAGRHHRPDGAAAAGSDLQQNVSDLAASLGIPGDQLVQALRTGLAGGGGGASGYGVSASLLQGLRFDRLA